MLPLCFLNKGIRLILPFPCVSRLSVCLLCRPMRTEGCATWDGGNSTWGGRAKVIGTVPVYQFWATVKAKTVNGEVQLQALVDGKKVIIIESTVRRDLQLEDTKGVDSLPNAAIFEQLTLMRIYVPPSHIKKIFGNMKRVEKGFFGRETPLFPTMMTKRKDTELPQTSGPTTNVANEAVNEEMDDSLVRAATTTSSLEAKKDSGNINKTQSKETPKIKLIKH
nr:hypothetical protein [Tanacetum cinerariifolium]